MYIDILPMKQALKEATKDNIFDLNIEEMEKAGLHFGHRTSKTHPKMKPYIAGIRNTIHIIDLEKTKKKLAEALSFIEKLISEKKTLLIVGTKVQFKGLVKEVCQECGLPYVNERWLGGTFTNFPVIKKRVEYMKELEQKLADPKIMENYKKKERKKMEEELEKLKLKFEGIRNLEELPAAIFVLDMNKDALAVKEASKKGVAVIGISDTNSDASLADYPIPANDDAISSVKYILDKIRGVILKVKNSQSQAPNSK